MLDHTLIGHIFILLAQIVTLGYQWFDAERRHRWQKKEFRHIRGLLNGGGSEDE